jgi:glutamyl-tRNA synthetase
MFFVPEPFRFVTDLEKGKVVLKNHPSVDLGEREISFSSVLFIPKSDAISLKEGEFIRLKQLGDFQILRKKENEIEARKVALSEEQKRKAKVIQWVSEDNVEAKVLIPKSFVDENGNFIENSLQEVKGLAEENILSIKENEIVQFERFGFCNYIGNKTFVFSC